MGHGVELNGENFLLGQEQVDEEKRLKLRAISLQNVLEEIDANGEWAIPRRTALTCVTRYNRL